MSLDERSSRDQAPAHKLQPLRAMSEATRRWFEQHQVEQSRARRKSTYLMRKEEIGILRAEMVDLTLKLRSLKRQREKDVVDTRAAGHALVLSVNNNMRSLIDSNNGRLIDAFSVLSDWQNEGHSANAISSFIHLTDDPQQRRSTLLALKEPMLAKANRYLRQRNRQRSLLKPYSANSHYETVNGDLCCVYTEVLQLKSAKSARQAYGALMMTMAHMEISIAERLGEISVREDYDALKDSVANYRLSSWNHPIAPQEAHCVLFAQFNENSDEDEEFGITVVDYVDQDDLHPYRSDDTVRRDITIACRVSSHQDPKTDQRVVVVERAATFKIHNSPLVKNRPVQEELQGGVTKWFDIWYSSIRDNVDAAQRSPESVRLLNDSAL